MLHTNQNDEKNYYDILEVTQTASADEIAAAKNRLAKKFHPDTNLQYGIDTTEQMQEILEAYRILSNPVSRADYDQSLQGHRSSMQTFDLKEEDTASEDASFVTCWKASGHLYELILESEELFRSHNRTSRLTQLSMQALKDILVLKEAQIPEQYWYPDIMNWLLFKWYQNRNFTVPYLLTLYDEYAKQEMKAVDRLKLQHRANRFCHALKRLMKY